MTYNYEKMKKDFRKQFNTGYIACLISIIDVIENCTNVDSLDTLKNSLENNLKKISDYQK